MLELAFGCGISSWRQRPAQQIRRFDIQRHGQFVQHIDAGGINTSLQGADIGAVNLRPMRKFLLRQAALLSIDAQIAGEYLSNIHILKDARLKSIQPRSILDKMQASP